MMHAEGGGMNEGGPIAIEGCAFRRPRGVSSWRRRGEECPCPFRAAGTQRRARGHTASQHSRGSFARRDVPLQPAPSVSNDMPIKETKHHYRPTLRGARWALSRDRTRLTATARAPFTSSHLSPISSHLSPFTLLSPLASHLSPRRRRSRTRSRGRTCRASRRRPP